MKVVILCGGQGTRLREETEFRPKPLVPVGDRPILWHVMKLYSAFGFTEFVLALGYKGDMIKDYFLHYDLRNSDFTIQLGSNQITSRGAYHDEHDWSVTLADTGAATLTAGRVRRLWPYLKEQPFMLTYGDGVADVDVAALLQFHREQGRIATVTAVRPPARFGELRTEGDRVTVFREKPQASGGWINGGFFVFEPGLLPYLGGDDCPLEGPPLEQLARDNQLAVYRHPSYWQCMDTVRDRETLQELWTTGRAPWKVWSDSAAVPAS